MNKETSQAAIEAANKLGLGPIMTQIIAEAIDFEIVALRAENEQLHQSCRDWVKETDRLRAEVERLKVEQKDIKDSMLATEFWVQGEVHQPNLAARAKQLIVERAKLRADLAKAQAACAEKDKCLKLLLDESRKSFLEARETGNSDGFTLWPMRLKDAVVAALSSTCGQPLLDLIAKLKSLLKTCKWQRFEGNREWFEERDRLLNEHE